MINRGRRGSVLVHVLVTGVIVAFIAAGLLRMVLMNYAAVDRVNKGNINRKEAEAMLNRATTYWNQNQVCASIPGGLNCSGSPGTCSCTCPSGAAAPTPRIVAAVSGGVCKVDFISGDPQ